MKFFIFLIILLLFLEIPPNTSTPLKFDCDYFLPNNKNNCKTEAMTHIEAVDNNSSGDAQQKSVRKFLGNSAVAILLQWFHSNKDYPYPDEATTDRLAKEASKCI